MEYLLLFLLSAIGWVNGVLFLLYHLVRGKLRQLTTQLGLLLLGLFLIRVGVSCVYFFEGRIPWAWVQVGLSAHYLIGPTLWAYVRVTLSKVPSEVWVRQRGYLLFHAILILGLGLTYSFPNHPAIWDYYVRYTLHALVTFYLVATGLQLWSTLKRVLSPTLRISAPETRFFFAWVMTVAVCLGFVVSLYVSYVLGPVIASVLFYATAVLGFTRSKQVRKVWYTPPKDPPLHNAASQQLEQELQQLIQVEKRHLEAGYTLAQLANELGVPSTKVSQWINTQHGVNFREYLNKLRIEEAQLLLREKPQLTVEGVGYEVGYQSKSTFFAAFKKQTGETPAAYQRRIRSTSEGPWSSP
ncbi:MAG TPA: hypothetical protein DCE41_37940 [Cytophagales bacterium]|nr:hypothetical protein [Cytophagales bacterium]HAA19061.1 hypothetical protein [Cytophagales bacterium]HAP60166.1 hypothetical protein [Cytophagales bacterium]